MKKSTNVTVKRVAKLWAVYESTKDGLELVRKEVLLRGRPVCEKAQVAITIAKGHVLYTMAYEDFIQNANKSEFIEEEIGNEN